MFKELIALSCILIGALWIIAVEGPLFSNPAPHPEVEALSADPDPRFPDAKAAGEIDPAGGLGTERLIVAEEPSDPR
ncbi:hypothetical protein [Haloferula helveola]